jgi:hypothetical protein
MTKSAITRQREELHGESSLKALFLNIVFARENVRKSATGSSEAGAAVVFWEEILRTLPRVPE